MNKATTVVNSVNKIVLMPQHPKRSKKPSFIP